MNSRWLDRWKSAGWNDFVLLVSGLGLCLCGWIFLSVARAVMHGSEVGFDERLMLALRHPDNLALPFGPSWLPDMARDISAVGSAVVIILLSLLVIGFLVLRRQWRYVALLVVAIAGGHLVNTALKGIYARERPQVVPHLTPVNSASFPSGHSAASSVVYLTMGALLAHSTERKREKIYFIAAAFALTFLIGLSRVFLGVHYPTDVLAGWSIGTTWALVCWLVVTRLQNRTKASV